MKGLSHAAVLGAKRSALRGMPQGAYDIVAAVSAYCDANFEQSNGDEMQLVLRPRTLTPQQTERIGKSLTEMSETARAKAIEAMRSHPLLRPIAQLMSHIPLADEEATSPLSRLSQEARRAKYLQWLRKNGKISIGSYRFWRWYLSMCMIRVKGFGFYPAASERFMEEEGTVAKLYEHLRLLCDRDFVQVRALLGNNNPAVERTFDDMRERSKGIRTKNANLVNGMRSALADDEKQLTPSSAAFLRQVNALVLPPDSGVRYSMQQLIPVLQELPGSMPEDEHAGKDLADLQRAFPAEMEPLIEKANVAMQRAAHQCFHALKDLSWMPGEAKHTLPPSLTTKDTADLEELLVRLERTVFQMQLLVLEEEDATALDPSGTAFGGALSAISGACQGILLHSLHTRFPSLFAPLPKNADAAEKTRYIDERRKLLAEIEQAMDVIIRRRQKVLGKVDLTASQTAREWQQDFSKVATAALLGLENADQHHRHSQPLTVRPLPLDARVTNLTYAAENHPRMMSTMMRVSGLGAAYSRALTSDRVPGSITCWIWKPGDPSRHSVNAVLPLTDVLPPESSPVLGLEIASDGAVHDCTEWHDTCRRMEITPQLEALQQAGSVPHVLCVHTGDAKNTSHVHSRGLICDSQAKQILGDGTLRKAEIDARGEMYLSLLSRWLAEEKGAPLPTAPIVLQWKHTTAPHVVEAPAPPVSNTVDLTAVRQTRIKRVLQLLGHKRMFPMKQARIILYAAGVTLAEEKGRSDDFKYFTDNPDPTTPHLTRPAESAPIKKHEIDCGVLEDVLLQVGNLDALETWAEQQNGNGKP